MAKTKVEVKPIKLKNVRLSFPVLDEPQASKDDPEGKKKYRAAFLLDPSDKEHRRIIKEVEAEAERLLYETFGDRKVKLKPTECYGDGDEKISEKTGEVYDGYDGMFFVQATNDRAPKCLYRNKDDIDVEDIAKVLYAGCYVNASVNLWIQDNSFGKAVRCSLRGVQFYKDGEPFGGTSVDVDKEFDDFDDDDFDDDPLDDL